MVVSVRVVTMVFLRCGNINIWDILMAIMNYKEKHCMLKVDKLPINYSSNSQLLTISQRYKQSASNPHLILTQPQPLQRMDSTAQFNQPRLNMLNTELDFMLLVCMPVVLSQWLHPWVVLSKISSIFSLSLIVNKKVQLSICPPHQLESTFLLSSTAISTWPTEMSTLLIFRDTWPTMQSVILISWVATMICSASPSDHHSDCQQPRLQPQLQSQSFHSKSSQNTMTLV